MSGVTPSRVARSPVAAGLAPTALIFAALLGLAAPAEAQVAGAAGGGASVSGGGSPLLTGDEISRHVEALADDELAGRRAGTPGAERAARYVMRAFQAAGLGPPTQHPTYLQTFSFPVGVELGPENRLVLQHGSRLATIFQPGRDFLPLAGALSDRVVQPIVFAGYGISAPALGYDDYEGLDVRGKIVLVLRFSPEGDDPGGRFGRYISERHKAAIARERGARAILFVHGPATEEIDRLIPFVVDEEPGALGIVAVSVTQGVARRIVAEGGGDLSAWQREIDSSGAPHSRTVADAVINLRADLRVRARSTHNVIGVLPGRDPVRAREAVVVGAHYDGLGLGGRGSLDPVPGEIHNGADDNASGVAALLELAQFFAYPTNRPARTLVFVAFGAEEEGMLGSAHYVAEPVVPLADVVAMINLDMIGRLEDELIVYGVGSSEAWPEIVAAANARLDLPLRLMPEGYGPSDHAAFYLRQVPVLAFFTGVHQDYHRSTDDAERIDVDGTARVTGLTRDVIGQLAEGRDRPAFDPREYEPRAIAEATMASPGGRLGAVPAPEDTGGGVVLEAVLPGSPAAEAGLRPGDRIVRLGARTIATIYDYVRALEELLPERTARVVVEREGRRMALSVVPAPAEEAP